MRLAKMMMAVAACSLAVSPAIASSAASKLSLSTANAARASTDAGRSNEEVGGFLVPLLAVVAVIGGVLVLVDEDDTPDSP
ncbi:hypothetical protein DAH66_14020 [Sphingomonas koreensis]|uniref:Ferrochelatase n=1 Tax=Sphingomonas koreensis TaxID=93064 RepID=A0A430G1Q4_9SPHN|nr:hypothetical protein DAH66_14020 [Sphingomonas koreensis]